ncbi:hypothetical protein PIB30_091845 [Stylosanthes scabra]|uniref:Putative plant transposon protein domain-containing protein n=1 Tax=Stylosanthes scabra TaxID=79078 RepID=A0ABU6XVU0_9FABA|nr:hypothetical protein [Stylosanthes scabra]
MKPTTTPKSTRRRLRSGMTRKSSGEHFNRAKKCYFTTQDHGAGFVERLEKVGSPHTSVSKLLVKEFYANAAIFDEEAAEQDELPYKSFVRGNEVDFSPSNIRRVMRFKRETAGVQTDYKTRQAMDQRLDEVLADLCIPGATWKLSSGQPAVPI